MPFVSAVAVALAAPLRVTVDPVPLLDGLNVPPIMAVTDTLNEPLTDPWTAEMFVCPTATPVTTPVVLTVAAAEFDDPQVTDVVMF